MVIDGGQLIANDNTRRILTLLYRSGPLSKPELAERGGMAWATAVKITDRLVEGGIIRRVGIAKRPTLRGKRASLFDLTDRFPIAIGIDVEYNVTTVAASSLKRTILAETTYPTPREPDRDTLRAFLCRIIPDFLEARFSGNRERLVGVGIGLPGIGVPSWSSGAAGESHAELARYVSERVGLPVRIQSNTRSYTVYEKWTNQAFSDDDFLFLSIRTGVGSGIFLNGSLVNGHQGLAGEIGHLTVDPAGLPCRCGRRGCLETAANQHELFRRYRQEVLGIDPPSGGASLDEIKEGLADLFTKAKWENRNALTVVEELARNLAKGLAAAVAVLNPPVIILSGHFGPDGDVLVPLLKAEILRHTLSRVDFSLRYCPFDEAGHNLGAALLVFSDFFVAVPERERSWD